MSKYKDILNIVQNEDDFIDLSVNAFDKKIEGTLREVNNNITRMLTGYMEKKGIKKVNFEFALANKVQLENLLKNAGYYKEVETLLDNQTKLIDDIVKEYNLFDYKLKFTNINKQAIRELIKSDSIVFENIGKQATSEIYNGIYNSLLTDTSLSDSLVNIRNAIDKSNLQKYAGTYANTAYMEFNRSVSNIMSNQTGWNTYQFVGPIDAKISHDFCLRLPVGRIVTKTQIDQYSKEYGFDVFVKGGGWNCRHKWINVPPDYKVSQREQVAINERLKQARLQKSNR
jgi:hypothetical protein